MLNININLYGNDTDILWLLWLYIVSVFCSSRSHFVLQLHLHILKVQIFHLYIIILCSYEINERIFLVIHIHYWQLLQCFDFNILWTIRIFYIGSQISEFFKFSRSKFLFLLIIQLNIWFEDRVTSPITERRWNNNESYGSAKGRILVAII